MSIVCLDFKMEGPITQDISQLEWLIAEPQKNTGQIFINRLTLFCSIDFFQSLKK